MERSINGKHNELYCYCASALITEMTEMKKALHFQMGLNFYKSRNVAQFNALKIAKLH